jgi:hypothetical protein
MAEIWEERGGEEGIAKATEVRASIIQLPHGDILTSSVKLYSSLSDKHDTMRKKYVTHPCSSFITLTQSLADTGTFVNEKRCNAVLPLRHHRRQLDQRPKWYY